MSTYFVTLTEAIKKLRGKKGNAFVRVMKDGDMAVEYFEPKGHEARNPHAKDALYFIARGHGSFNRDGKILPCKSGDLFFVPAGMPHSFEKFSDDFSTWIVLYGPDR